MKSKTTRLIFSKGVLTSLAMLSMLLCSNLSFAAPMKDTEPIKKVTSSYDCGPISINMAAIQPVRSGLWNDAGVWPGGNLPTSNDDVTVPAGTTVTMVGTCRAKSIVVRGTLNAVNWQPGGAWIELRTQSILVTNGGKMEIGTETEPYHATERCRITLTGAKNTNLGPAYKAILVQDGGTLELHGEKRMSWTNLMATANAGANQITLKEPVDWEVGDVIAITSTELARKINGRGTWENVDQVEIQSISGDKRTLTLTSPLQYKHCLLYTSPSPRD